MGNENVLSTRYATPQINGIFSDIGRIRAERELWIAVMKAQKELGVNIPAEDIVKYERAIDDIDPEWIEKREKDLRHDVKAKIEAFVNVSGAAEHIHRGMTSRDLTDNVEQMQIRDASNIMLERYAAVLHNMLSRAQEYAHIQLVARTHHQAAQPTLLGRRFSMWAEELLIQLKGFEQFVSTYPLRGIKGPVGTQFDMITLLGTTAAVDQLEGRVADHLGFKETLNSPGQVYPRSLDYALVSHIAGLTAGCENFAKGMRLMAGYDLVTEGFKEGQVGSTAMPHKMNTRSAERICSLSELTKMYADGASRLSGDQWEEGDVSCSALRRIVIPDSFYAADGVSETTLTVLKEMGAYPTVIANEVDRYLPFLATTELLTMATQAGMGRESAHKLIKQHSVAAALAMRNGEQPRLVDRLVEDPAFNALGISEAKVRGVLQNKEHFVGNAYQQIQKVTLDAAPFMLAYPSARTYTPQPIL